MLGGPAGHEHFKMNLYEQFVSLAEKIKMLVSGLNDTPVEDMDVDEITDEVTTFAQTWLASNGTSVTPPANPDIDVDMPDSESDSEVEAPNPRRKKAMTNKRKKAEKAVLLSLRRAMSATNGRTHVGKTLQRAILLATCEAPPLAGPRTRNLFGGLKCKIASVLGVRPRLVDEGEALNRSFHSSTFVIGDFVKRRVSGRGIPEEVRNAVRRYYLDGANTRESPNRTDQLLVWNPVSGKKDLRVSKHWLEVPLRVLHKRWLSSVRPQEYVYSGG